MKTKPYKIGKLFEVVKGKRLPQSQHIPGEIPYVSASAMNNGITDYIGNTETIFPPNTISVSYNGSVGACFYQDQEYWASDDINVLIPNFPMLKEHALYIMTLLSKIGKTYGYNHKWKRECMLDDYLVLPTRQSTIPDWATIEELSLFARRMGGYHE